MTTLVKRLWAKIKVGKPDECWPWMGRKNKGGYGTIKVKDSVSGKWNSQLVHRVIFKLHSYTNIDGLDVCHSCDNPPCGNPKHLFAGTAKQNIHDSMAKGRWQMGARHYRAKLTDSIVRLIRRRYHDGNVTYKMLAVKLGVTISCVREVIKRRCWKHVT